MFSDSPLLIQLVVICSFIVSAAVICFGRKHAESAGLIDKPNERKLHSGHVPLLGGIAVGLSLLILTPLTINNANIFSIVAITLSICLLGVVDDIRQLSAKFRLLCQLGAGLLLAVWCEVRVVELGNVLGFGALSFNYFWSLMFTAFCVVGVINAFNMIDGIDGLFGGTSIITLVAIALLCYQAGRTEPLILCLIVIGGLAAFLAFNLGLFGSSKKVFAGDSGSTAIGFLMAAILILATQGSETVLNPVAAGWLIGLPLVDTVAVMAKRIWNRESPFSPGRDHFHHHLTAAGFSSSHTLAIILCIQLLFVFGAFLAMSDVIPDSTMFYLFVAITIAHFLFGQRIVTHLGEPLKTT